MKVIETVQVEVDCTDIIKALKSVENALRKLNAVYLKSDEVIKSIIATAVSEMEKEHVDQ